MALAIEKLRDRVAVPKLIEILNGAPDELVRSCASQALMEIKDARALDTFADHLSDPSQYVRYNSLIGIEYITHAPACTIAKPEDAEKAEPLCKIWWESSR
jgi:HEAT repeat protein